jgi:hypothetical protein
VLVSAVLIMIVAYLYLRRSAWSVKASTISHLLRLFQSVHSLFIGLLSIARIPLVVALSIASGYTTYHGLTLYIHPYWIALVLTCAVQTIIVNGAIDLARIYWSGNRLHFISVFIFLRLAFCVSVFFSYFTFYEIFEATRIKHSRYALLQQTCDRYIRDCQALRAAQISEGRDRVEQAEAKRKEMFFGTSSDLPDTLKGKVGYGRGTKLYDLVLRQAEVDLLRAEQDVRLEEEIRQLRPLLWKASTQGLNVDDFSAISSKLADIGTVTGIIAVHLGRTAPEPPVFMSLAQYTTVVPQLGMLWPLSWSSFTLAVMIDIFTLILSYRLETSGFGEMNAHERRLTYLGLQQFSQWSVNKNNQLQCTLTSTERERAAAFNPNLRLFVVAKLLNEGYMRRVDNSTAEFDPRLYEAVTEHLVDEMNSTDRKSGQRGNGSATSRETRRL